MTIGNIYIYLIITFVLATILGITIMIWWYKKISKRLNKNIENSKTVNDIAIKSLIYNFPSLIVFCLLFVPSLYFGYLSKQHNYCKNVVTVNTRSSIGFNFNDPEFIDDCGCFDINELNTKKE